MSAFYVIFLVLLAQTPATETHPGFPQMTILEKHDTEHSCKKSIKTLDLTEKEKEGLLCVRVLKGDVNWVEA